MITYRQSGETLIPDLKLNETEERPLGKYGRTFARAVQCGWKRRIA